ncbi:MAG: cobalamin-dependent protein [Clostridiaceae bacterium]
MGHLEEVQYEFEKALLNIDRVSSRKLFENFLNKIDNKEDIIKAIEKIIVISLKHIGDGWEEGKVSLAQVYMGSKICVELIDRFIPGIDSYIENQSKIAMCCFEDYHLIGKQIVSSVIKANGYKINDYGCGVKIDMLIDNIVKDDIEVIIISTLMLSSALKIKELKKELDAISSNVKIIVGGAPFLFDSELWNRVGADAMSKNVTDIIIILNKLARRL